MHSQQIAESKADITPVPREVSCTVCQHSQRDIIDGILASGSMGRRTVANRFGLTDSAVQRHRANHLTQRMVKAVERRKDKADDVFMERHEHLFKEALQYVEDAKSAIKMQKVTVLIPDKETGKEHRAEEYREFRDVGAMAPALGAATALQRVLGDATGRFASANAVKAGDVHLHVVLPRAIDTAPSSIEGSCQVIEAPKPEE